MKILHTEWSDDFGGQEKRILAEVSGMIERGHNVAIACRKHAKIMNEASRRGIKVYTLPMRKPYDPASIYSMFRIIQSGRFDIVNTHSGVDSWIAGIAAKMAGTPVLARTRHLNIPLKRNLFNFIHYLPDIYIACGENMKSTLIKQCGFPSEKVQSIPTGVNPEFFKVKRAPEAKLKYGISADSKVIANVGILRKVKGHEITLKSVKKVVQSLPDAKFLIAGDGPRRHALEDMTKELGISEHVIFTGFVQNIPEIYSFADVAILSSWSEGLPQSVLQAMASGVPVVATGVGGVPEVVIDGKTGMLVEPGDHEALAKGIIYMFNNPEVAEQLAANARELVLNEHSTDHMIDKTEILYKELLTKKQHL